MCKNVSSWDLLMKIDESQGSVHQMNQICMDMTYLFDSLKHSVLDYADGKKEGNNLCVHIDKLTKETTNCTSIINDAIKNLEDSRTLLNKFLEKNN